MDALCSARQARAKRTSRHDFHPRPEYTVVFQDADDLVLEMKRDEYAQRVNARPVGGPRSNLPRPRSDPGWAAQGGGGRNIRSPPRTGPWIGPGVVAEPPREPRRAVLGRCGCDSVPLGLKGGANAIGGSQSHDAAGGVRVPASLSYEMVGQDVPICELFGGRFLSKGPGRRSG